MTSPQSIRLLGVAAVLVLASLSIGPVHAGDVVTMAGNLVTQSS